MGSEMCIRDSVIEKVFGGGNRREVLRAGMTATLARLQSVAEAGSRLA